MSGSQGLRWSETAVGRGRQRLGSPAPARRLLSSIVKPSQNTSALFATRPISHSGSQPWRPSRPRPSHLNRFSNARYASWSSWLSGSSTSDKTPISIAEPVYEPLAPRGATPASVSSPSAPAAPPASPTSSITTSTTPPPTSPDAAVTSTGNPSDVLEPYTDVIQATPNKLGYLYDLGLDYGWGPSSIMQWSLEHIHVFTGMPWWASTMVLAIVIRAILFRPSIKASEMGIKMREVQSLSLPITTKMREYARARDQVGAMGKRAELKALYKARGIKTYVSFLPMIQIPFGFGGFRLLRGMSELPVPALEHERFLWIGDLTLSDPYCALGVVSGAVVYLSLRRGGEMGTTMDPKFQKIVRTVLPAMSGAFLMFQPGAVAVYFFTQTMTGLVQSYLITSPAVRRYFNVPPMIPVAASADRKIHTYQDDLQARQLASQSFIDRTVGSVKKNTGEMTKTVKDQYNAAKQAPKQDRLAPTERKQAAQVEAERTQETNRQKQERNLKAIERARMKREEAAAAAKGE